MSSIVNKIKDAVHEHKDNKDNKTTDTHTTTGTSTTGNTGTYGGVDNAGSGFSGDQMTSRNTGVSGAPGGMSSSSGPTGEYGREGYTAGSTNRGPHDSNTMNKADPRVDSDRDGRAAGGLSSTGPTEFGSSNTATAEYGSQGYTAGSSNRGPHDSNAMNKADPRVDSDRDGRAAGAYGTSSTTGSSGLGGSTGPTEYGSQGYTAGSTNRGPHDSNAMNKADPRVDSDRDGRAAGGLGSTGTTGTSGLGSSNTYGTSGTTGTTGTAGGLMGSSNPGPAPNTAGPHGKDMLNKADPRVDSNLDGSKTVGGDKTYNANAQRDPTDAAQAPPSVLSKHLGEPSMEHDDHEHDRARRNSKATHQESHLGM